MSTAHFNSSVLFCWLQVDSAHFYCCWGIRWICSVMVLATTPSSFSVSLWFKFQGRRLIVFAIVVTRLSAVVCCDVWLSKSRRRSYVKQLVVPWSLGGQCEFTLYTTELCQSVQILLTNLLWSLSLTHLCVKWTPARHTSHLGLIWHDQQYSS